ncbi:phospholipid phosphatase-related protein type 4 isoform X2 [Fundulus heteroclitus]|uniref:phospholipid phosphatase-related protein type 4 isoform X2 n=1 Tax=Fundulus heteroclitus TaxID=8078 RepID=UPI00165CAACE|nr:phospholipid phosphatase-related protein type 4 isoform X2 [Fundulus heteroclitus]
MSVREKGVLTKDSVSLLPCFYFVELPILVSSIVSLYFLEWTDVFKPVKSGYNCHDRSLSLPYIDPNHEVIPFLMLLSLAFAGPAITIMIGEGILFCCLSQRKTGSGGGGTEANINAAGCNFNSFIRRAIRFVGVHAFGLCATALITDILQLMTGYPTPYFLTVCKPNYTTLNISCEKNPYVIEDICSGADPAAINQGRKSFPSQHATLASFAAVYISGVYAVGNFQSSEETSCSPPVLVHHPSCSLPHVSQEAVLHHLQMKASMTGEAGIPTSHSESVLHRGLQQQRPEDSLKHSNANVEGMLPCSPQSKDAMMTFSHTLPRVHTPQAIAAYEEAARRHAATLHHASMDSSRSKQLLSQWKSKNNNHKCSMISPDSFSSSVDSSSGHTSHLPHHGSIELRSSSEPSTVGINGGLDPSNYMSKLTTGISTTLPTNCSGITGGARISMQSRPGSSQLVHIPEDAHESYNTTSQRTVGGGGGSDITVNSTVQANWQKAAEKTGNMLNTQPRIIQMIAMSKQQGLLQTHSKSLDESSMGFNDNGSCQGNTRYRGLTDQDPVSTPVPSSLGSTASSILGSTGAIVRVEAHPENNRPVIQAPSTDGSGSWRWRSLDHGNGVSGNTGTSCVGSGSGPGNFRQTVEHNDQSVDSESSDSVREGSVDRKHGNDSITTTSTVGTPSIVTVHTQSTGQSEQRLHPQSLSTIRVTPGDGSGSGAGGGGVVAGSVNVGGETSSEIPSIASSRESTLRRKSNNIFLIPERANSPDNARNVFYKGISITPTFKE